VVSLVRVKLLFAKNSVQAEIALFFYGVISHRCQDEKASLRGTMQVGDALPDLH
jgi:hypothetical protein